MKPYEKFREYCQRNPEWMHMRQQDIEKAVGYERSYIAKAIKEATGKTILQLQAEAQGISALELQGQRNHNSKVEQRRKRFKNAVKRLQKRGPFTIEQLRFATKTTETTLGRYCREVFDCRPSELPGCVKPNTAPSVPRGTRSTANGFNYADENGTSNMQPRTDATLHQRNRSAIVRGKRLAMGGKTKRQLAAMHAAGQISDAEWKGVEMVYNGEY